MREITLFDSELKVMEIIWEHHKDTEEFISAKEISKEALTLYEWNKNTTYTVIKKLVKKEALERREPNFMCIPLVSKDQVRQREAVKLVDKLFNGSSKLLVSSFIEEEKLTKEELESLRDLIDRKL